MPYGPQTDREEDDALVRAILEIVRSRTGLDFSGYRTATIRRRIGSRMAVIGVRTLAEYERFLAGADAETVPLVERLTIKVSRFYRNPVTFDCLREQVVPGLMEAARGGPLRFWSAGCGYGEEAYTLAMLLDEAGAPGTVQATDIDVIALELARVAIYPPDALADLPPDLTSRYLEPVTHRGERWYRVCDALRSRVRFAQHDLTTTAPVPVDGPVDLVTCRNVLIYLERPVQATAVFNLRRALAPGGFLCLGESEWPPASAAFEPLDFRTRIFRPSARASEEEAHI